MRLEDRRILLEFQLVKAQGGGIETRVHVITALISLMWGKRRPVEAAPEARKFLHGIIHCETGRVAMRSEVFDEVAVFKTNFQRDCAMKKMLWSVR